MISLSYSIIIPAYNEAEELPETLKAIKIAMSGLTLRGECIVVDNNSTDKTDQIANQFGADRVVYENYNQIARARNAGAAESRGKYLVFVDADTRIESKLLNEALRQLESGKYVGGGSVVRFEGNVSIVGHLGIRLWEAISKLALIAAGSFIFCRRDAFEAVGGFDEVLYASEEVRFSNQIKRWGKKRGMKFSVLEQSPAMTSARKLEWFSGIQILAWASLIFFMPIIVRSRRLCSFWYKRPIKTSSLR